MKHKLESRLPGEYQVFINVLKVILQLLLIAKQLLDASLFEVVFNMCLLLNV